MNNKQFRKIAINAAIPFLFVFCIMVIVVPIFAMDANYALSMVFLFWLPAGVMLGLNWKWMRQRNLIIPFLICNGIMDCIAFYFEYVGFGMNIWHLSENKHLLLKSIIHNGFPWTIYGAPIEEFMFWFGATPFCILLYISFLRLFQLRKKAYQFLLFAAWPVILTPFIPILWWMNKKIKGHKILSPVSMFSVLILFVITLTFVEHHAIIREHWVFHENRIFGPRIWGIPIEEYFYYILGPAFVILLFHFFELQPAITLQGKRSTNEFTDLLTACRAWAKASFHSVIDVGIRFFRYIFCRPPPPQQVAERETVEDDFDEARLIQHLKRQLEEYHFIEAENSVRRYLTVMKTYPEKISQDNAQNILKMLWNFARFEWLYKVADATEKSLFHRGDPATRLNVAQSDIELKKITDAIAYLLKLKSELDEKIIRTPSDTLAQNNLNECLGLLGRSYKQLYIDAKPNQSESRYYDLQKCLEYYGMAYSLEYGDYLWNGVNYMAMLAHAERLTSNKVPRKVTDIALLLIDDFIQKEKNGKLSAWDYGNRMEAYLAMGETDKAIEAAKAYLSLETTALNPFHVQSTQRQLMQIWQLNDCDEPGRSILPRFTAKFAELGGGAEPITLTTFGSSDDLRYASLGWFSTALKRAQAVVKLEWDNGTATGFIFNVISNGDPVFPKLSGKNLILTNSHACSNDPDVRRKYSAALPEEITVLFSDPSGSPKPIRIKGILWSSPPDDLDASLLEVSAIPEGIEAMEYAEVRKELFAANPRANIIGHPKGLQVQVSLHDNKVSSVNDPKIWYRSPTDPGSSGSPVFDHGWRLIAMHHARDHDKCVNEGIRMDRIVERMQIVLS